MDVSLSDFSFAVADMAENGPIKADDQFRLSENPFGSMDVVRHNTRPSDQENNAVRTALVKAIRSEFEGKIPANVRRAFVGTGMFGGSDMEMDAKGNVVSGRPLTARRIRAIMKEVEIAKEEDKEYKALLKKCAISVEDVLRLDGHEIGREEYSDTENLVFNDVSDPEEDDMFSCLRHPTSEDPDREAQKLQQKQEDPDPEAEKLRQKQQEQDFEAYMEQCRIERDNAMYEKMSHLKEHGNVFDKNALSGKYRDVMSFAMKLIDRDGKTRGHMSFSLLCIVRDWVNFVGVLDEMFDKVCNDPPNSSFSGDDRFTVQKLLKRALLKIAPQVALEGDGKHLMEDADAVVADLHEFFKDAGVYDDRTFNL